MSFIESSLLFNCTCHLIYCSYALFKFIVVQLLLLLLLLRTETIMIIIKFNNKEHFSPSKIANCHYTVRIVNYNNIYTAPTRYSFKRAPSSCVWNKEGTGPYHQPTFRLVSTPMRTSSVRCSWTTTTPTKSTRIPSVGARHWLWRRRWRKYASTWGSLPTRRGLPSCWTRYRTHSWYSASGNGSAMWSTVSPSGRTP